MEGYGKIQWKNGFVYKGELKKHFITGKGYCLSPKGTKYFAVDYLPNFKGFGRIFLAEGKRAAE